MQWKMGVVRPQNGSIIQPRMMHRWNWGISTHAILMYVSSNRKKVFLILCAFMMGTWMGSLLPYSEQNRSNLPLCIKDKNVTNLPRIFVEVNNESAVGDNNNNSNNNNSSKMSNKGASFRTTVLLSTAISQKRRSGYTDSFAKPLCHASNVSNCTVSNSTSSPRNAYSNISTVSSDPSNHVNSSVTTTGQQFYFETEATVAPSKKNIYSTVSDRNGKFLVNSRACKIPYFHPRDPSIQHAIKKLGPLSCGKPPILSMKDNFLRIDENSLDAYGARNLSMVSCCYHVIRRPDEEIQSDDEVEISNDCTPFFDEIYIREEYIKVRCQIGNDANTTITDFYFTTPLKPEVEKRCGRVHVAADRRTKSDPLSVMMLGMDAVSRLNFQRHLIKTRKVLLDNLKAVEMLGYNKVGDNTFPNLIPVFSGMSEQELSTSCWQDKSQPFDDCPWIWKSFARAGYRTAYGEDSTQISCFNYLKEGFRSQPTDYYFRPFLQSAEQSIGWKKNMNTKLCLGPHPYHEVTMGWARSFMRAFPRRPYFGFVWSNSLTHDDANFVQMADDFLSVMLNELHLGGYLNNTVLILLSDHGIRWGSLRETLIGGYEERLPALYVSVPQRFRDRFPEMYEMLWVNSQRLTSPYDLHRTLLDILKLNPVFQESEIPKSSLGLSLFEEVPPDRKCRDAGINPHWCSCDETIYLNVSTAEVMSIAEFIVEAINNLTREHRDQCEPFTLSDVFSAQRTTSAIEHVENAFFYSIIVVVKPGGAKFEATVLVSHRSEFKRLEGEISRLNLYNNQSSCISNRHLKKFCYCSS